MIGLRRYAARVLTWLAVEVDPDPRWDADAHLKYLSDLIGGFVVGRGVTGRKFPPDSVQRWTY